MSNLTPELPLDIRELPFSAILQPFVQIEVLTDDD
jgi:hypothetical protein